MEVSCDVGLVTKIRKRGTKVKDSDKGHLRPYPVNFLAIASRKRLNS